MKPIEQLSTLKKYGLSVGGMWGVWLILTGTIYFLVIGPQNTLMAKLSGDFTSSNEEYALAQIAGRQDTKVHIQEKLQAVCQKTSRFVISADNAAGLMFQVSQLAIQNHLRNFSTKARQVASTFKDNECPQITETWQELSFFGDFTQAASFLNSLERIQPVVFIESIEIRHDLRGSPQPEVHVLISYMVGKPENKEPNQPPGPLSASMTKDNVKKHDYKE